MMGNLANMGEVAPINQTKATPQKKKKRGGRGQGGGAFVGGKSGLLERKKELLFRILPQSGSL